MNHRSNFIWVGSDEPHATRRKLILSKHPEIKDLMKIDTSFKWKVLGIIFLQFSIFYLISGITNWIYLSLISYFVIGTIVQTLFLAVHEIAHGQAFGHGSPWLTIILAILTQIPTGIAISMPFKRFHLLHHRYQGDQDIDYDLPTDFEAKYVNTRFKKFLFVLFQGLIYTMRPLYLCPTKILPLELTALIIQLVADYIIYQVFGLNVLLTMLLGSILGSGLHPCAGHFISEHYVVEKYDGHRKDSKFSPECPNNFNLIPETCSYYGPLNYIQWNVGYHVEHHDFPSVPGSNLPLIKKIAPEFYDGLPYHTSQCKVLFNFIMNPQISLFNRVKREVINKKDDQ